MSTSAHAAAFDACAAGAMVDYHGTADAVAYYDPGPKEDPIVVAGVLGPETTARRKHAKTGALEIARQRSVMLRDSSLARGAVKTNGTVEIGGQVYAITHVGEVVGEVYEIELEAIGQFERTRDGYRK